MFDLTSAVLISKFIHKTGQETTVHAWLKANDPIRLENDSHSPFLECTCLYEPNSERDWTFKLHWNRAI